MEVTNLLFAPKEKRKERGRNQKEKELLYYPEVLTLVIRKEYGRIVI